MTNNAMDHSSSQHDSQVLDIRFATKEITVSHSDPFKTQRAAYREVLDTLDTLLRWARDDYRLADFEERDAAARRISQLMTRHHAFSEAYYSLTIEHCDECGALARRDEMRIHAVQRPSDPMELVAILASCPTCYPEGRTRAQWDEWFEKHASEHGYAFLTI